MSVCSLHLKTNNCIQRVCRCISSNREVSCLDTPGTDRRVTRAVRVSMKTWKLLATSLVPALSLVPPPHTSRGKHSRAAASGASAEPQVLEMTVRNSQERKVRLLHNMSNKLCVPQILFLEAFESRGHLVCLWVAGLRRTKWAGIMTQCLRRGLRTSYHHTSIRYNHRQLKKYG